MEQTETTYVFTLLSDTNRSVKIENKYFDELSNLIFAEHPFNWCLNSLFNAETKLGS